ncbi:MAG: hypothetical protein HY747_03365 [Elusimicrobia bacterium]|nr:hypothetical protein [Elusimicrobiota bacterium]
MKKACPNIAENRRCCECIAHHRASGKFPACVFTAKAEATFDRSFAVLLKDRGA